MRRIVLAMTESDLASMLGVTDNLVANFEAGSERIGAPRLVQLCQVLSVPMAWFFDGLGPEGWFGYGGRLPPPDSVSAELSGEQEAALLKEYFALLVDRDSKRLILEFARKLVDLETLARDGNRSEH
jgi:transcriptional regulator with XRE-family HTH domain